MITVAALFVLLWSHGGLADIQAASAASRTPATVVAPRLSAKVERDLRARVSAWWVARERRDHQQMYGLFEPTYRKQVTFADFLKESAVRSRFDIADTRVEAVVPETVDRVRVMVNMETRLPRSAGSTRDGGRHLGPRLGQVVQGPRGRQTTVHNRSLTRSSPLGRRSTT